MEEYLIKIIDLLSSPSITDWLMLFVTLVYVGATIFICVANCKSAEAARNQIGEMQNQQKQNVGIQLYSLRKEAMELVKQEKYNEVYWDIPILFDKIINAEFNSLTIKVNELSRVHSCISFFEQHLKEDVGEDVYAEFINLKAALDDRLDLDNGTHEALFEFCKHYTFSQYSEVEGETTTYDYKDLSQRAIQLNRIIQGERVILFLKMQEFVKDSIS